MTRQIRRARLAGEAKHSLVVRRINDACRYVVEGLAASDKRIGDQVKARGTAVVVLNSSLVVRDKNFVKSVMAKQRLSITIGSSNGALTYSEPRICTYGEMRKGHVVLDAAQTLESVVLEHAIEKQVDGLGDAVFILLGTLGELEGIEVPVKMKAVPMLRLVPDSAALIGRAEDGSVVIKKLVALQSIVDEVQNGWEPGESMPPEDRVKLANALDELQDQATTRVSMPSAKKLNAKQTILGKIEAAVAKQVDEYEKAVKQVDKDPNDTALRNDVLRIAYNFCSDVLQLMYLIMSACDLKPILFWCTIDKQWAFEEALNKLPWVTMGTKPSLSAYKTVVSNARSHAFHHVLPFDSTCDVDLSRSNVKAESIKLFEPFAKKQGRGVRITDHELLEVFAEFSRAKSRDVTDDFWAANIDVMKAAHAVVKAVLDTLVMLHSERSK